MGMQDKERIARIGSVDPGSHLGIPFSHVSANNFRISCHYYIVSFLSDHLGAPLLCAGEGGGEEEIIYTPCRWTQRYLTFS
jgi:hypothetical protein